MPPKSRPACDGALGWPVIATDRSAIRAITVPACVDSDGATPRCSMRDARNQADNLGRVISETHLLARMSYSEIEPDLDARSSPRRRSRGAQMIDLGLDRVPSRSRGRRRTRPVPGARGRDHRSRNAGTMGVVMVMRPRGVGTADSGWGLRSWRRPRRHLRRSEHRSPGRVVERGRSERSCSHVRQRTASSRTST